MLEQVEQQRLRPLDVVDRHQQRCACSDHLEQPTRREERVLRRAGLGGAHERAEQVDETVGVGRALHEVADRSDDLAAIGVVVEAGGGAKQLGDRGERRRSRALAPDLERAGLAGDRAGELTSESGLADARGADHGAEARLARGARLGEDRPQLVDLLTAADERNALFVIGRCRSGALRESTWNVASASRLPLTLGSPSAM